MANLATSISRSSGIGRPVWKKETGTAKALPPCPSCHRLLASLGHPELRSGDGFKTPDPGLRLLWQKLLKVKLSEEALGDLCSAAIQYSHAHYMQAVQAFLRKGGEIPEHKAFKQRLRKRLRKRTRLKEMGGVKADRRLLKEIATAEADRKRWTDRRARAKLSQIADLAAKLDAAFAEVVSSQTLYLKAAAILTEPMLNGVPLVEAMRFGLQKLTAIDRQHPTQSELHQRLRKEALSKMFETMPSGKPNWALLADLIYEASGKNLAIAGTTLRTEYASLLSEGSAKKRGVVTQMPANSPRDRV